MTSSRVTRGRESERIVADYLAQNGWPYALKVGAAAPGRDITGTPGLAFEVKARRGLDIMGWIKQAVKNSKGDVPILVHRPDGYGPAQIADWPATMPLEVLVQLLWKAGYHTASGGSFSED